MKSIDEAVKRACEEETFVKALSWIAIWETERIVKQARENKQWDTMFEYLFKQVADAYWDKTIQIHSHI